MTEQATASRNAEGNPRARVTVRGRRELPLHQWCINEVTVPGVLTLPTTVTIEEISFELGYAIKQVASSIPAALREIGVTYMRESSPSVMVQGTLTGARTTIERNAKEIARRVQLDYRKMRVKRMKVSHQGTEVVFTAMTKKMPSAEGREGDVERVKVLGLVLGQGQSEDAGVLRLVRAISAARVNCRYTVQPVRTVICTR